MQLYGSQAILNQQLAFPVRYYAKEAAPAGLKGDGQYTRKLLILNGFLPHMCCLMTLKMYLFQFQSMFVGDDKYSTKKLNVIGHVITFILLGA